MIKLYSKVPESSIELGISEEHFEEVLNDGSVKQLVKNVTDPGMYPFIPDKCNGTAVIVIPGGAFKRQVLNKEGYDIAKWLNSHNIAAFVLKNRLPVNEHKDKYDVILKDCQRAIRVIRSKAEEFGIKKIGIMGFSAGGYSAAIAATGYYIQVNEIEDEVDLLSAKPDFAVLGYPAISSLVQMTAFQKRGGEIPEFELGQLEKYNPCNMVTKEMPPVFIFETDDDKTTPSENSIKLYMAMRSVGAPAELHIFAGGGHGFGLGENDFCVSEWKNLFTNWLKSINMI